MDGGVRLDLARVRGLLERLVFRVVAACAALVAVWLALAFAGWAAGMAVAFTAERAQDRRWAETLAPLQTYPDRAPTVTANATALLLEEIAAEAGIELAPSRIAGRVRPPEDSAQRVGEIKRLLEAWAGELVAAEGDLPIAPEPVAGFIDEHSDTLRSLVDVLEVEDPPVWDCDVTWRHGDPLPNLIGHLVVQRMFASEASNALRAGHEDQATHLLDASWRLNQANLRRPETIAQLVGHVVLAYQMQVVRRMDSPPAAWVERLGALDLEANMSHAFQGEAFWSVQYGRRARPWDFDRPLVQAAVSFFLRPYVRLCMIDHAEALRLSLEELPSRDLTRFEAEEYFAEQMAAIPRWNWLARKTLPNVVNAWPRTVRVAVGVELTLEVITLRSRLASGELSFLDELPTHRPSRQQHLNWLYTFEGRALTVELDGDPYPPVAGGPISAPLRFNLDVAPIDAGPGERG